MIDHTVTTAGHVVGRDDRVCDLALERGRKAVAYDGQAGLELIGVHVLLPCSVATASASDLKRQSRFAVNLIS